jgi:hypothetical protein
MVVGRGEPAEELWNWSVVDAFPLWAATLGLRRLNDTASLRMRLRSGICTLHRKECSSLPEWLNAHGSTNKPDAIP